MYCPVIAPAGFDSQSKGALAAARACTRGIECSDSGIRSAQETVRDDVGVCEPTHSHSSVLPLLS